MKVGDLLTAEALPIHVPDGADLMLGEFRMGVLLATLAPALCHHVRRVVRSGSEEQVIWSDTQAIVATVEDAHPDWHRTVDLGPCEPMRSHLAAANAEPAVTARVHGCGPDPAVARPIDLRPEAIIGCLVHV
jgi:hypothetical protein